MEFETARASTLLDEGAPLVGTLRGGARIAVAGYVGGGRAALDAIERAGFDVLRSTLRATRTEKARRALQTYRHGA
jgi:phytoene/squalene synthetase